MEDRIAYVTNGEGLPDDLASLDRDDEFSVTAVDAGFGGERPLPERTACVVIDHDPPAVDALVVASWVNDRYPRLPIVLYPTQSSEALIGAALNVDFDAYVPACERGSSDALRSQLRRLTGRSTPLASGDPGSQAERASPVLRSEEGSAADQPGRRSTSATDTMFKALLTSLPRSVSIYVKDRLGRHLAVSGGEVTFDEDSRILTPENKWLNGREDVLGKTDFDLYPSEHAEATKQQERRIMRTEEPDLNVVEEVEHPLDRTMYYSTSKAPWYDESGNVAGIVGITIDISERVRRKRALERQNERLDRFAGVLSHDIRNPLNLATGQLLLLKEQELSESTDGCLDDLEWSLQRIEELVQDTLTLAREGARVDDPVSVDLAVVAHSAWRSAGDDRGTLDVDADLPSVGGDPDRVQRLFENLFRNALEHGRSSDATEPLTVSVGRFHDGFYVADDGRGIPDEDRETVFEHGFTTDEDGTGFGLAIVEEITAAHGWTVDIAVSEDGGARFEFGDVSFVSPDGP